jgi:hypothetical protein
VFDYIFDEGHGVFGEQHGRLLLEDGLSIAVEALVQGYHYLLSLLLHRLLLGLVVLVGGVAMV